MARSCQRRHHYEWDLGIKPVAESAALRFGTLVHLALEAWWLAQGEARLDDALAALRSDPKADPFEVAKAEAMMRGYHVRWKDEPYDTIGVESEFTTPLVNPDTGAASKTWELGGTIDAIVRDRRDGRVLLVEHKTSSVDITQGSDYWKRLRLDNQVSTYFVGAASLGLEVDGCLYDVLGKPLQRPLKASTKRAKDETPDEYLVRVMEAIAEDPSKFYQRGEVVRLEGEVQEAMRDAWQLAVQLRDARAANSFPRNPDACIAYNTTCPFFGACSGEESLDDPARFTQPQPAESSKEESHASTSHAAK